MRAQTLVVFLIAISAVTARAQTGDSEEPRTWQEHGLMQGFPPAPEKQVSRANWMNAPYNRYAFQNIRALLPTAAIPRGDGVVVPLPVDLQPLGRLEVNGLDGGKTTVEDALESVLSDGIVVLHRGTIVYEQYWNGMTRTTPHWLASCTKSFTGTLVDIMIARGLIDENAPMGRYVPGLANSGFADATVRQVNDMQVGMNWNEDSEALADPNSPARQYGAAIGLFPTADTLSTYDVLPTLAKEREHGNFHYHAPSTDALGWLLEAVTQKPYVQILGEEIWSKLGTEGEAYLMLDNKGKGWSTGGMNVTARDLARFGLMMQNGGRFNGKQVVPETVVDNIRLVGRRAPRYVETFEDEYGGTFMPGGAYRSKWWVFNNEDTAFQGLGVFGQFLYVNPTAEVTIVRFSSQEGSNMAENDDVTIRVLETIADHLRGR